MSKGSVQRKGKNFQENFDKIFGADKKVEKGSFIQIDGKLVPRETVAPKTVSVNAPQVMDKFKPFASPIDGKMITSREQLRAHHKEHGTTDSRDYGEGYIENRARQRIEKSRKEMRESRMQDLKQAYHKLRQR